METKEHDINENEVIEIDVPLDEIFTNLKNLSKINVGDKLSNDNKYITIDTNNLQFIKRWYLGQSRYSNLEFINKLLLSSYNYSKKLQQNTDDYSGIMWINLNTNLKNALGGLLKLRQTYITDEQYTKEIDIIIKKLCKNI
jgi:hypothetical protein